MRPFTTLDAIAAPLPEANIDTDKIIPARFLKTVSKSGLGGNLFADLRYDDNGGKLPDFILNRPPYDKAQILVVGDNFGCGSSREHAPWALCDFGITCLIAPRYADIFYNNCFNSGILPIILSQDAFARVLASSFCPETAGIVVNLPLQRIELHDKTCLHFEISEERKKRLLAGTDDITESLDYIDSIEQFERGLRSGADAFRKDTGMFALS